MPSDDGSAEVVVDTATGSYIVCINQEAWFVGQPQVLRSNGAWFIAATPPSSQSLGCSNGAPHLLGTVPLAAAAGSSPQPTKLGPQSAMAARSRGKLPVTGTTPSPERTRNAAPAAAPGVLQLVGYNTTITGSGLGMYHKLTLQWKTAAAVTADSARYATSFRVYPSRSPPVVTFEQHFPDGLQGTQLGVALDDLDQLITAFPRFSVASDTKLSQLGYFTFRYVSQSCWMCWMCWMCCLAQC